MSILNHKVGNIREFSLSCDNNEVENEVEFWDFDGNYQIDTCGITEINFKDLDSFKKFYNQLGEILMEIE